jgi:uncharacterized membrane protein YkgB
MNVETTFKTKSKMNLKTLATRADSKHLPAIVISVGICLILFWIGALKFTPTEAEGISPLITHSPFTFWMNSLFGQQGTSDFIGVFEYLTAIGIIIGFFKPRIGMIAGIMAILMFFVTFSFFFSTPGTVEKADGLYGPTRDGGFLFKDLVLLGASFYLFTFFGKRA